MLFIYNSTVTCSLSCTCDLHFVPAVRHGLFTQVTVCSKQDQLKLKKGMFIFKRNFYVRCQSCLTKSKGQNIKLLHIAKTTVQVKRSNYKLVKFAAKKTP